MSDKNQEHTHKDEYHNPKNIYFECPSCGKIERDDVIFLCNTCQSEELIYKDGIYMCPTCLKPGKNFECVICESTDVKMKERKTK